MQLMDRDDDLERAIALSLMEVQASHSQEDVVSVDISDEEEDHFQAELQCAIEASKAGSDARHSTAHLFKPTNTSEFEVSQSSTSTPSSSVPFLYERAQLEKERLERRKHLRGESDDHEGPREKSQQPPVKRQHLSSIHERTDRRTNQSLTVSNNSSSSSQEVRSGGKTSNVTISVVDQLFWDGELRPTANRHSQPRKDGRATFRMNEVLGPKTDISFAIISSYSTSVSWIYEFFDPHTPVILAAQPDQSGQAISKNILPNWIMTVPFLRNGRGCQHMKFMLIFYKTGRLRVVVSTANLVDYDWRDIENVVWLQDVPPRSRPLPHDPKVVDDFPSIMQKVLHAVNVRPALANMLANDHPDLPLETIHDLRSKWDFSKVRVKLIPSIAGKHEGWPTVIQTGHTRLMKAVRDLGLRTGKGRAAKELTIECQGSSIGTYSTQWLNEFHLSARGESADDWLDEPKTRRAKLPWPAVKIIFPSLKTVRESVLGEPGGGTMFCRTNQWEAAKFPRELFYDSNSAGGHVLMHSKMIIATVRQKSTPFASASKSNSKARSTIQSSSDKGKSKVIVISDSETESETKAQEDAVEVQNEPIGWAYVGSHNFTPSAWGTLSGSGFNPVLNIVNYELGILFPLYEEEDAKRVSCFHRPARKYVLGEDRPWIQEESPAFGASSRD
ncbi:phospholipase D/nuclease [Gyrodon lividus]|nr:phospholipase D/nuclease [Gyrodon lividus]